MKKILFFFIILNSLTIFSFAQGGKQMHVLSTFPVSGPGGWDYIAVGPINNWLYVSHGTQVNIINMTKGDSVGIIEKTTGVHGIAFAPANREGFTSNGRLNTVTVFDMNTNKTITEIHVGANPDAIVYDPFSKMILTCNGRSKNLSIVDPSQNKLIDSIDVGGRPETAVSDGEGRVFVNIEDKNEIAVIDMKTFKVLYHWSIAPGDGPAGLAIDIKNKRLFSGCDKLLMIIDANDGKIIDKLPIGEGSDGVEFDPKLKNIYSSNGEGTITVIHEDHSNTFKVTGNITTKKSARTITLDKKSHQLFLPAAEFEALQPGEKGRPQMKPGSFGILVVGY